MFIEISWTRSAAAQGVHFGTVQTIKIIELHGAQWATQLHQFSGRIVKLSPFVIGADDEYSHVSLARCLNGLPIQIVYEIPMDVEVFEAITLDRFENDVRRGMSRKT